MKTKTIGDRLRDARKKLDMTQSRLASSAGIPLGTYKKYEGDDRVPGAEALAGLAKVGININWLLSGDGPVLLHGDARRAHVDMVQDVIVGDPAAAYRREARFDGLGAQLRDIKTQSKFLRDLIEAGETALEQERLIMTPADKAQFYSLLYEMFYDRITGYAESQQPITTDNVIPFVKGMQLNAKK